MNTWSLEPMDNNQIHQISFLEMLCKAEQQLTSVADWLWDFLGSLFTCTVRHHPISCVAFGWTWTENIPLNTSKYLLLLLPAVTSSVNTSEPIPLATHPYPWHNTATRWCERPWIMSSFFPSPYPSLPIILVQVPDFICQKNLIPELKKLFRSFLAGWPRFPVHEYYHILMNISNYTVS